MKLATINNWAIVYTDEVNPYSAPELLAYHVYGEVQGHPDFQDGEEITTSPVRAIDVLTNKVQTSNNMYNLGEPSEQFLDWLKKEGLSLHDYNMGTFNVKKD